MAANYFKLDEDRFTDDRLRYAFGLLASAVSEEWPVCKRDAYPAYLTWDQFIQNQQTLRDNWFRAGTRGAPRKGTALLQGIARCGRCGAKMNMYHFARQEKRAPSYVCNASYANGGKVCQTMSSAPVDTAVTELFLAAVTPAQVDVALRALDAYEADQAEARRQRQLQVQQAEYEAELARRRYEAADPANRLVAGELEARWEQALRERERLTHEAEERDRQVATPLGAAERRKVRELAADLGAVWHATTTEAADRKELLRFLVHRVYLDGVVEPGQIRIEVEWHTGARTRVTVPRPMVGWWTPKTPAVAVERIRELVPTHEYTEIVKVLNSEGLRTAKGQPFNYDAVSYIARSRGLGRCGPRRSKGDA